MCSTDIFLGFLAILFPPLPVWVKSGICSADSFINLLLCVLGFLPGLLHAWYIIAKNPTPPFDYDGAAYDANESGAVRGEGGQRIYVFVHDQNGNQTGGRHHHQSNKQHQIQPQRQGNMNYGTTTTSGGQHAPQDSGIAHAGPSAGGDNAAPPPSYAQVVAGDHKVQTQD
ncbi:hypothetical protein SMACR_01033 [Sordaria macrospora]|uniref:WGS project CABT00000000 data, contig 2.2 n=2 Tax=Sordaria macrospora TaxID=5147 RepID=F7VNT1_SORMK|nr:uncharacterized protein SMAC_01033 [Sordaria macrospora k-hell]KAA8632778.1 hypothetical protein SMACR_01033 [Sordaria macrospora]KAH7630593.1 hypothetical protein B0T09DRAFT_122441 [Sordaria sp. MPI-SDFR-AT-0083]WPJ62275.1 hypothetical protein SMAC4_01033 [Sordaria macrospora]CCC07010.1 unnamed protein product [Sordaria macrospora k-hell]